MKLRVKNKAEFIFLLTAIILVSGFIAWQSDLASDPPMYYSGLGQSLSTDPYMYNFHARNKILFGEPDPLHDPRWVVFKNSLVSLASYGWLSLTDITLIEANTVGILLSLLGLCFIIVALTRHHSPWVTAVVAFCYLANVSLLTYGRLPYLENGLLFLFGLLFLVWTIWNEKKWAPYAVGVIIAAATIGGKLFGALLLPAICMTIFISGSTDRWRRMIEVTATFIVSSVLFVGLLYYGSIENASAFLFNESVQLHGFPEGLTSPLAFIEHLISFGEESNLFYLNPDLLIMLLVGISLVAYRMRKGNSRLAELPPTTIFSLCWIISIWVGLMPVNYSPLRYSLMLIPAIIIFTFTAIDYMISNQSKAIIGNSRIAVVLAGLIGWIVIYHGIMNTFFYNDFGAPRTKILWLTMLLAGGITYGVRILLQRKVRLLNKRILVSMLVLLLISTTVVNAARIRRKHFMTSHFSTIEANQDLKQIVSKEAVIAGPYALAITFQTDLQSLIHFFNGSPSDSDMFLNYPITHLAVDESNWRIAVEQFPELKDQIPIARYWIRDYRVQLFNVSRLFGNTKAQTYHLSAYEQAVYLYQDNKIDSAFIALGKVPDIINTSKSAGWLFSQLFKKQEQLDYARTMLTVLADRYPTDFSLQLECGHFLQQIALARNDKALLARSGKYFERAVILNPYRAEYANRLFGETLKRMSKSANGHSRP